MEPVPSDICSTCKRFSDKGKPIVHKVWCTEGKPRVKTRGSSKGPVQTPTKPTPTTTATASTMAPPSPTQTQEQVLAAQKERIELLEQQLRAQEGMTEVQKEKLQQAEAKHAGAEAEFQQNLQELQQENQTLRTTSPSKRPPPPPSSVHAMLEAQHAADERMERIQLQHQHDMQKLMEAVLANQNQATATSSKADTTDQTAKVNPSSKNLNLPMLEDPSFVNLHNFKSWHRIYNMYAKANGLHKEPFHTREAHICHALHANWQPLLEEGYIKWTQDMDLDGMLDGIAEYIKARSHPLLDRRDLFKRVQRSSENHETFMQQLGELVDCARLSEDLTDPLSLQDMGKWLKMNLFLAGLSQPELRKEILKHPIKELTLEKVKTLARDYEKTVTTNDSLQTKRAQAARKSQSTYKKNQKSSAIQKRSASQQPGNLSSPQPPHSGSQRPRGQSDKQSKLYHHEACGQSHAFGRNCPAQNTKCTRCGTTGHVPSSSKCSKSPGNTKSSKPKMNVRTLKMAQSSSDQSDCINVRVQHHHHNSNWSILPDSGADITACSINDIKNLLGKNKPQLKPAPCDVTLVGGILMATQGTLPLTLTFNDHTINISCYVLDKCDPPLLGKTDMIKLGLLPAGWPHVCNVTTKRSGQTPQQVDQPWNLDDLYKQFPNVFRTDGNFKQMKGPPVKITLTEGAIPFKLYKPYSLPLHYEPLVKEKLDQMLAQGVVERVPMDQSPDWTAGLVVTEKKDSSHGIRITVDLSMLNRYIKRPGFAITVPADKVKAIPPGMCFHTVLDAISGF